MASYVPFAGAGYPGAPQPMPPMGVQMGGNMAMATQPMPTQPLQPMPMPMQGTMQMQGMPMQGNNMNMPMGGQYGQYPEQSPFDQMGNLRHGYKLDYVPNNTTDPIYVKKSGKGKVIAAGLGGLLLGGMLF